MSVPSDFLKIGVVGYTDRGEYSDTSRYYIRNIVHFYGFPYICIRDNGGRGIKGIIPYEETAWRPMVAPNEDD